ncbi:YicC family protein [Empedobacter stercoris]|uniref:YicC family protein n=2 Tax=Empedobacter TaxID=59734 RepID=A0ABY8V8V8_9FLAO|nr:MULTISPECIES: YicC/YloC family endoribonuclease [Empedobacter]UWX66869.1 YicC family protein [Empedobacter stercoris]WIH97048.1 YicC family protein [Empedobacter falsenii]HJD87007.1 YicC family protein [Empedobacter falsenii]
MIASMTGYGKAVLELPEKKVTIEIRSLNSKTLDLNTRIPSFYREKELEIRNLISEKVQRGKIDFSMLVELNPAARNQSINAELIKSYMEEFKSITPNVTDGELLPVIMRLPDVISYTQDDLNEEEWNQIRATIIEAINALNQFRLDEGKVLEKYLTLNLNNILELLTQVIPFEQERIETIKERFNKRLEELKVDVDQNRFEQEMIFYLEKLDITEEKVRLKNHCEYFLKELAGIASNGKKLGFISQEIGREINTLGSKSNHSEMQKIVVQMKDELEKIKEQSLNIL